MNTKLKIAGGAALLVLIFAVTRKSNSPVVEKERAIPGITRTESAPSSPAPKSLAPTPPPVVVNANSQSTKQLPPAVLIPLETPVPSSPNFKTLKTETTRYAFAAFLKMVGLQMIAPFEMTKYSLRSNDPATLEFAGSADDEVQDLTIRVRTASNRASLINEYVSENEFPKTALNQKGNGIILIAEPGFSHVAREFATPNSGQILLVWRRRESQPITEKEILGLTVQAQ